MHQPVDTAQDFVIGPLRTLPHQPATQAAITIYESGSRGTATAWTTAYEKAVANATDVNGRLHVPAGPTARSAIIIGSLTAMAQTGGLDGTLLSEGEFYNTNYTKPLLFIADGTYLANLADAQHLSGDQWGMMNETGNFPGQAWLWLYTMWYQVPPMNQSTNADLEVWGIMMVLSLGLILLPFIPILRSIPRWTRVYRLIWRSHYRELAYLSSGCSRRAARLWPRAACGCVTPRFTSDRHLIRLDPRRHVVLRRATGVAHGVRTGPRRGPAHTEGHTPCNSASAPCSPWPPRRADSSLDPCSPPTPCHPRCCNPPAHCGIPIGRDRMPRTPKRICLRQPEG